MTLMHVKVFEAKFLGLPLERDEKGNLNRNKEPAIIPEIGKLDDDELSPTYGKRVCEVGEIYELDEFQLRKWGGAFDKPKELPKKGYTIDDGETPEEANKLSPKELRELEEKKQKNEAKLLKEKEKRDAELAENAENADTVKKSEDLPVHMKAETKEEKPEKSDKSDKKDK